MRPAALPPACGLEAAVQRVENARMSRQTHVYTWDDERPGERPSEFARSTGYAAGYSTQHGSLGAADSGFTRPSPLPRERAKPRRKLRELPASLVATAILGGTAFLLYELARLLQR